MKPGFRSEGSFLKKEQYLKDLGEKKAGNIKDEYVGAYMLCSGTQPAVGLSLWQAHRVAGL